MSASNWQKASRCAEGSNCVEVRRSGHGIAVQLRESTDPERVLRVAPAQLGALLRTLHDRGSGVE